MSADPFHCYGFRAFGVAFEISTNAPELIERLSAHFPPGFTSVNGRKADIVYTLTDHRTRSRRYEISDDEGPIPRSSRFDNLLETFEARLRIRVAELAPNRVFVHSGVVGWNGRAILLPGRSYTGKTTLVRELIRRGAEYYSDEYAVLDNQGRVHPFTRPLEIRVPGGTRQKRMNAEAYGARVGDRPIPVGLVVISAFHPGSEWKPRKLSAGRGALQVLLNTVPARRKPQSALQVIQRVVASAPVVSSKRGEASRTATAILQYVDDLYPDN